MTVEFNEIDAQNVEVLVNGATYGKLNFDSDANVWVLWPEDIDDGVSYFDNLEETEESIKDEIIAFDKEN
ncbi:hypothetical protein MK904_00480 [Loigolactobacillus coryniformis]|uniref:hypothetical protein n=1 Tax=Loigolactobacillus coryniformis TaxID=1610 RepID=UPI00233FC47E|nr:hypothetical protein [Loigolactobacillus coryniformis]MDC4184572.1 hypothetical protein [Loigolactobacillus coryniformis]